MYNYYEAVVSDVIDAMDDIDQTFDTEYEFREYLYDYCWVDDSVTGNASGSYTFSANLAEENLVGNWGLAAEAIEWFRVVEVFEKGAEYVDVIIRCYLLDSAINDALNTVDISRWVK